MKEKVQQWLTEGCNWDQGLTLLSETGKHKSLIRSITGRPGRYAKKLKAELLKSAGLPYITQPLRQEKPSEKPMEKPLQKPAEKLLEKLPEIVEKVIREHSETFLLRSRLHEQLRALPADNDPVTVKQRKNLSDSLSLLSARIDKLFAAKEAWYNQGLLPYPEILFDNAAGARLPTRAPENPKTLKKLKKNLQTSNTKDQNLLDYQEVTKTSKPNPMPPGPKRLKLETRIKQRLAQIEQIDFKLLKLS